MVGLAAQVRRRPPVHHALVDHQFGDVPARAGGDLRVEPGRGRGPAQGGAAADEGRKVVVDAQERRHGGIVEVTADTKVASRQGSPTNGHRERVICVSLSSRLVR